MSKTSLTEGEVNAVLNVYDYLSFSQGYDSIIYSGGYYNSPETINRIMKNKNMTAKLPTLEELEKALLNPKDNETLLKNFAQSFELTSMYYKRLIDYNTNLLAFNITFDIMNITKDSEYNSKEYKADLKILEDFCSRFNFKEEFSKIVREMLRQGGLPVILKDEGDKYTLQDLPVDFTKITGRHEYGLLYDFNFAWFINTVGVDINMYPKIFKKMYREVFTKISKTYIASKNTNTRNSTFAFWHQCSPKDGFWYFKLQPEIATLIPYYTPIFPDLAIQPTVRKLQTDKYFIEAAKLLVGIIGFNKEGKTTSKNNLNMDSTNLGKFMGTAREALIKQIGLTALPLESVQPVEFNVKERNMQVESLKSVVDQSTASSAALLDDNRLNAHQSQLATAVDSNFVTSMYPMFESFVEYFVNMKTKKYKFKIKFNDVNTPDSHKMRNEMVKQDLSLGLVDIQDMARVHDLSPFQYEKRLMYSKSRDITKYLTAIGNPSQTMMKQPEDGVGEKKIGRPTDENSISDDTMRSNERQSNDLKDIMS